MCIYKAHRSKYYNSFVLVSWTKPTFEIDVYLHVIKRISVENIVNDLIKAHLFSWYCDYMFIWCSMQYIFTKAMPQNTEWIVQSWHKRRIWRNYFQLWKWKFNNISSIHTLCHRMVNGCIIKWNDGDFRFYLSVS